MCKNRLQARSRLRAGSIDKETLKSAHNFSRGPRHTDTGTAIRHTPMSAAMAATWFFVFVVASGQRHLDGESLVHYGLMENFRHTAGWKLKLSEV